MHVALEEAENKYYEPSNRKGCMQMSDMPHICRHNDLKGHEAHVQI